ncbi:putative NRPS-like protein biosynthetic cluster [Purpureocillium takamizusanense]|uniref:NRPS-like protein biosynthetic cluster n=1 Tax=Purpureocillium takamizusanense TaxID=2060973 RepID=A0A9Q8V737_9HYPO|nr:putative NRPS-like protein biosynthetic cluster [Purpureocillium takamizusanense]UNI15303.1 putative NRPS-like protein biosynthetic cluster [Purpureocillium takamizusanense]
MEPAKPNYFTCTLGEAALAECHGDAGPPFSSIIDVVDQQAQRRPDEPAVGFARFHNGVQQASPSSSTDGPVTYGDLHRLSLGAARALTTSIGERVKTAGEVVGLLCGSSLEFVLTWLGLMRLGHPVLLLAPQLEPRAIKHLCHQLDARILVRDDLHEATAAKIGSSGIEVLGVPPYHPNGYSSSSGVSPMMQSAALAEPAFYFHTSGTSSGLASPVPQRHSMAGALPRLHEPACQSATFSTTPLYHGGLADCLRAWASGAMIWLFPDGECPLTARNITQAVDSARRKSVVPVTLFSSVPYVLEMLAEDADGLRLLASMDLVGVGGAALSVAIGDKLVRSGVNLLSRFGSAECGFLLSSHREYTADKEWDYLRVRVDADYLRFEPRESDGLWELIVQPRWPFRSKTNREDGSYATSDLFERHPHNANAWRYHSRADAQITLANGKKFDPSPMEAGMQSATPLLREVYVFGSGEPCAGALLFPQSGATSQSVLLAAVRDATRCLNAGVPGHARIEESMLVVVPSADGENQQVPKSSKGSFLRHQANVKFAALIEGAYAALPAEQAAASPVHVQDGDLLSVVADCFHRVMHRSVDPDRDLYQQGVDSIACIQIRKLMEAKKLVPSQHAALPLNVIYDQGTVTGLVAHLQRLRHEDQPGDRAGDDDDGDQLLCMMKSLASRHRLAPNVLRSSAAYMSSRDSSANAVLLTGATGFLGAHLLALLRQRQDVARIYCLVRASTKHEARDRVSACQVHRGFPTLPPPRGADDDDDEQPGAHCQQVVCLPFDLAKPHLGLAAGDTQMMLKEVTLILHSAWPVNFNLPLTSFGDQLSCLSELLALAVQSHARFCFVSSVAAVSSTDASHIAETISNDPLHAAPLGYARSKWVAERMCAEANCMLAQQQQQQQQQ